MQQNAGDELYTGVCALSDFAKINDELAPFAAVRHRILQHGGRRYSVKLEQAFWACLEAVARREGMRLNELVAELAGRLDLGLGFAAALRLYCLTDTVEALREAERQVTDLSLAGGTTDIAAIVAACPAPCMILAHDRSILRVNDAFVNWLQIGAESLVGQPADRFFQIRGHFRLDELWARLGEGHTKAVPAKLAYLSPGRVTMAKAHICAASVKAPDDFSCLVMLDSAPVR